MDFLGFLFCARHTESFQTKVLKEDSVIALITGKWIENVHPTKQKEKKDTKQQKWLTINSRGLFALFICRGRLELCEGQRRLDPLE